MKAESKRPRIQELSKSIAHALGNGKAARSSTLFATSGGALLGVALAMTPAHRAAAQDEEGLVTEQVVVTGSRIPRRDFTANSPITTIDEAVFEETTAIGVETILNQLPQFTPAVTQFTTFDVENTATNTVGASTVSLRGLGPNRNLVLINGKRAMPINPTMVVDTNSIPASAIERVEVISGGASAVYGADAVGGVVNFILKEDFEGASVDVRFGDTQHGGNQEISISGLIGANVAGDRGNVIMGVERSSRSKQMLWERDWRVRDYADPTTGQTQVFPTETWFSNPWGGPFAFFGNFPNQAVVNGIFDQATPCGPEAFPGATGACPLDANGNQLGVRNSSQIYINRTPDGTGTVFAGLNQPSAREGAYRYEGPYNVDNYGQFAGLPFRVIQPDGAIKENTWYQQASIPLDRLSAFGRGVFAVSDTVKVNAQAMFTRTENITALGATSDTIGLWGAAIPFGNGLYAPSVTNLGADGLPNTGDAGENMATLAAYQSGGLYGIDCPAVGGCTKSQAWPVPQEIYDLFISRPQPELDIWVNRTQDDLRYQLGDARGSNNHTTTMQLSLGIEGELPSGNDFWDVSVSTGRTDTQNVLTGSIRLTTYRQLLATPNYGTNFRGDPNPAVVGFAEGNPTCTSGIPIVRAFNMSDDCIEMLYAPLQNQTSMTQSLIEANLVGDLVDMKAGPLGYALGTTYREASFVYTPDNLIRNGSTADAIAGTFPTTISRGDFDVAEVYGELLIPIVSGGPTGVEHFSVELGGRISDWSMQQVDKVQTYKGLIDWGITPRYRIRGGYNRAMRAPNLGELYVGRSQVFQSLPSVYGDQCSQNHLTGPFSANPAVSGPEQAARTLQICRELMGPAGAFEYYDNRPVAQQPTVGGVGTQNTFGNPDVHEEQADTLTLGVVMDFADNWTLTVDYYEIEIKDMIAIQSPDSTFESCLSLELNPSGSTDNIFCQALVRNPANGGQTNIDLTFTNQGRAKVAGADFQLNWTKMFANGGFNMNLVGNYSMLSETQDRPELDTIDWVGTRGCALQIECQGYDYRTFTTLNYFHGPWNITLRHQFWPTIYDSSYAIEGGIRDPRGNVNTSYQLVYLGASYSFNDKYTLRVGIENLLDTEPPYSGGDPTNSRFVVNPQHVISAGRGGFGAGGSSTYEPLGRRGFVSVTMDF